MQIRIRLKSTAFLFKTIGVKTIAQASRNLNRSVVLGYFFYRVKTVCNSVFF